MTLQLEVVLRSVDRLSPPEQVEAAPVFVVRGQNG